MGFKDVNATCLSIENAINSAIVPTPRYELEVNEQKQTVSLTVFEGGDKPYMYERRVFKRADSSTVEVNRLEYNRLALEGMNTSFDALAARTQDLTFARLEQELEEKTGLDIAKKCSHLT
ncbi:hypothetical protein ACFQY8_07470 [Alloscardovia venturai]|uniref:Uncharacterized protein n=1 Tax=Alloscardovia venturai TaxID=1769421 RepID=A0ABW2Y5V0_9BIFI